MPLLTFCQSNNELQFYNFIFGMAHSVEEYSMPPELFAYVFVIYNRSDVKDIVKLVSAHTIYN